MEGKLCASSFTYTKFLKMLLVISQSLIANYTSQRYNEPHIEQIRIRSTANNDEANTVTSVELEEDLGVEDEEEEEEFTPSAWNAALAPHRSALRSPDKTLKSGVSAVKEILDKIQSDSHSPHIYLHDY